MASFSILWRRYLRYSEYFVRWLIFEKPRGLDFSMRVKARKISGTGNHGYALTSRRALKNLLRDLSINREDGFLDIGCGKGGVLCYASEFDFGRIGGIEVDSQLVRIARKNMQKLGLRDRVDVTQADALTFDGYSGFNFFFLFNPFDPDIYSKVLTRILEDVAQKRHVRTVWLLCYGDCNDEVIQSSKLFDLYRNEVCPYRGNGIRVWKSRETGRAPLPVHTRENSTLQMEGRS